MLQNLLYFWNKKIQRFFFILSNFGFVTVDPLVYVDCYKSKVAKKNSFDQFIHLSALGIETATDSNYALSKLSGEQKVRQNFPSSVIFSGSHGGSNTISTFTSSTSSSSDIAHSAC